MQSCWSDSFGHIITDPIFRPYNEMQIFSRLSAVSVVHVKFSDQITIKSYQNLWFWGVLYHTHGRSLRPHTACYFPRVIEISLNVWHVIFRTCSHDIVRHCKVMQLCGVSNCTHGCAESDASLFKSAGSASSHWPTTFRITFSIQSKRKSIFPPPAAEKCSNVWGKIIT